ncbi:putative Rho GTPase activation protein [Helianthus annuus]|uniref:Rho GTPase activation protein n=1 Tax=Helianthus annuus TaxID=4232 RepID=A0A9K3N7L5_HELAN|nr:putative Rho GTPase activation protein [Helianthus annuus]KAJ0525314.1 putative Rho GTPase activation protein [Helianthus annuus]KAJ0533380.1 putative Rho GTPase activation protein [Helianthus annuus]KAJ0541688.1 putative Rho GTPase activation protein [Helianthus annuus]KAJ0706762.1 putative Rho GTPase activation protein [Helianthus annuus]
MPKNNTACDLNSDPKMNRAESKNNKFDWKHSHSDLKNYPDSKTNAEPPSQGDGGGDGMPPSSTPPHSHNGNKVYKSGPLFLSSKGIGWTSWKKRWFILTETSLVFFRSDPNAAASQKGGEANLTLGGIDLNSSGSVVVKADKKLLTVLFPDGRDGRAFTLKAETSEDLYEWKDALEAALSDAPSVGNNVSKTDKPDTADASSQDQPKEQTPAKSSVLGRPILLALEDIDGTPSFLEKALCYVEDFGVNVEGILRQAADVDDVERRIREYEQGKVDFTEDEDGHVIGDCIKYVLRELPSPPVPASCCAALLEAYRSGATRVSAMRAAICDTFPEPNRRLLQRILIMMEAVAENKGVNRMSVSAVAACMSPLLLRPLLAGEVELGNGSDIGGDAVQLLQAAAAANHAQAIVITLVEEYDKIFGEEDMLSDLYSDSDDYGSESGSDEYYEEDEYSDDDELENLTEDSCSYEEESDHGSSSSYSESGDDDVHSKGSVSSNSYSIDDPKASRIRRRTSVKKGSPLESIAFVTDQQAEIVRLEANKAKLKERIDSEVARRNAILKEDLVSKKKALEMRRVALSEEVSRLEEELQKAPLSASADEKTNADPENIDQSETNDPGLQHNQLSEQTSNDPGLQQKDKDLESTTTSHRNKDSHSNKEQGERHHFHSHPSKHHERGMSKSSSRRPRGEAANTTSALSKITNRLNFLKERRNQIADDLQDNDKDHKSQAQ